MLARLISIEDEERGSEMRSVFYYVYFMDPKPSRTKKKCVGLIVAVFDILRMTIFGKGKGRITEELLAHT
jgi:hypothetical protein